MVRAKAATANPNPRKVMRKAVRAILVVPPLASVKRQASFLVDQVNKIEYILSHIKETSVLIIKT